MATKGSMSRRRFVGGTAAMMAAAVGAAAPFTRSKADFDENLTALIADPHVGGKPAPAYMLKRLRAIVADIMKLDRLPRRAVLFGDLAWLVGRVADYEASAPALKALQDAGVELAFGMGNHDNRDSFLEVWPDRGRESPVPGRIVSVTRLPHADLLMLDTLAPGKFGVNAIPGGLDKTQQEWLSASLPKWPRPVIVCAHHPIHELTVGKRPLCELLAECPSVAGYIHGHNHRWMPNWVQWSGSRAIILRTLGLPSAGFRGDIGYALMRTSPHSATVTLRQTDFWYPGPLDPNPLRTSIVQDNNGQTCTFQLGVPRP